jgi:cysteine-rich repeat protein
MIRLRGFVLFVMVVFLVGFGTAAGCYKLTPLSPAVGAGSLGMYEDTHFDGWSCKGGASSQLAVVISGGSCDMGMGAGSYTFDGTYNFDKENSLCLENGPQSFWEWKEASGDKILTIAYYGSTYGPLGRFIVSIEDSSDSVSYSGDFAEGEIREVGGRLRGIVQLDTSDAECSGTLTLDLGPIIGDSYCRGGEALYSNDPMFDNFLAPNPGELYLGGVVVLDNGEDQCYKITEAWSSSSCDGTFLEGDLPILQKATSTISCCYGSFYDVCGDGEVDEWNGEECDDGNTVSGDLCSSTCTDEDLDDYVCGNGILETANDEECDDGNTDSGDGCDSGCLNECACPGDDQSWCVGDSPDKYVLTFSGVTKLDGSSGDVSVVVPSKSGGDYFLTNSDGDFSVWMTDGGLDVYWEPEGAVAADIYTPVFEASLSHDGSCCSISSQDISNDLTFSNYEDYYGGVGYGGAVTITACGAEEPGEEEPEPTDLESCSDSMHLYDSDSGDILEMVLDGSIWKGGGMSISSKGGKWTLTDSLGEDTHTFPGQGTCPRYYDVGGEI